MSHRKKPQCAVIMPDGQRKEYTKDDLMDYIDDVVEDNIFHGRKWAYSQESEDIYAQAAAEYRKSIQDAFHPGVFVEFQWDARKKLPVSPTYSWDSYDQWDRENWEGHKSKVVHGTAGKKVTVKKVSYTLTSDISYPPNPTITISQPIARACRTDCPAETYTIFWDGMDKAGLAEWIAAADINNRIYAVERANEKG